MKCPNCGAEIGSNKYCEYCGSQISLEMEKEQEQLNKRRCPSCGSSNISFSREKQGEIKGKHTSAVVHSTVGICQDCGYTWNINGSTATTAPKKRKTWLWVLGWLFIFPLPLTILLLRKKNMKPALKYGIIAVAWIIYLIIGMSGKSDNKESVSTSNTTTIEETTGATSFILNYDEQGQYGKQITLHGKEYENTFYVFTIPSGTYKVINNDSSVSSQITVYKDEVVTNSDGNEEMGMSSTQPIVLMSGQEGEITVADGECIKLSDGGVNISFEKIG